MATAKHPPGAQPRKGKGPGGGQFAAKPAPDLVAAPPGLSLAGTADSDSLAKEIDRVRADHDFMNLAGRLLERDKELLERLAK